LLYFARAAAKSRHGGSHVLLLFLNLFIVYFSTIPVRPIISYHTDFRQISTVGRTVAVLMINLKIDFWSFCGRRHGNRFLSVVSTQNGWVSPDAGS